MSVITSFKNRQDKNKAQAIKQIKTENVQQNTALALLAKLLNVDEENAISTATKYVENNINYFSSDIPDNKPDNDIEEHEAVKEELAADIENSVDAVQSAASDVENSAGNVNSAASKVESSADDLAYAADDITAATDELKEATAEIKKPSAAPKSSNSKNQPKQKNSTKK